MRAWTFGGRAGRTLVVALLAAVASLAATRSAEAQRYIIDPVDTRSVQISSNAGRHGACDFPIVDRGALTPSMFTDPRITPVTVLAGFVNFYRPGAPPFPCNHFDIRSWGGMLTFGLASRPELANRRATVAILNITEAIPFGSAGLVNRSFCDGGGCLRTTQAQCRFNVSVLQQPTRPSTLSPEELILSSPRFDPLSLTTPTRVFTVSGTGGRFPRPIAVDVTRDFRGWTTSRNEPGILIHAQDSSVRTNDHPNDCRVLFRAHLDVFVND